MKNRVPFAICIDFESLLILVEDAREIKTKKLNKHVLSGWCTYNKFAYVDVSDPLKHYRSKNCVETIWRTRLRGCTIHSHSEL